MALSQSEIADVRLSPESAELHVAWTSSAPGGTVFQVYVDRRLTWFGTARHCNVPFPADALGRNVWVEVGTVEPAEANRDFSANLQGPGGTGIRARLSWLGGTYLDRSGRDNVRGFRIYRSSTPGGAVDFSTILDIVPAYPGGAITDGFGGGGFGQGGFGRAASSYVWQSQPLASGTWQFAIVPYDDAGNAQGSPLTVNVTIAAAPRPPARDGRGARLTYTYSGPTTRVATLNWLASP